MQVEAQTPDYPAHWEADVVLSDGGTAHVRPIRPSDDERLVEFYARVSDRSKYFRFFAPYPRLSERDVKRFTEVDHDRRAALIVLIGDQMVAVGRYDRGDDSDAEVAFLVQDDQHGRGIGSVLLEHLAQMAREREIARFTAEILPGNRAMLSVFSEAGYSVANQFEDGVVRVEFPILPTDSSLRVTEAREHRAEARSIERLLTPSSVAVIGASRESGTVGHAIVRNLVLGDFTGRVYAVNPNASAVAGVPAYPSVLEVPSEVDLAVIALPAEHVQQVVLECAQRQVKGLIVVSSGFAESGEEGRERQDALVRTARVNGLRVVGPNCLGIANTNQSVSLNATLAPALPPNGRIGLFSQSGALGTAILADAAARGLGLSTFISAGNRADVSGNDLLQYWQEDPHTDVVLLYLESIGNPRKFSRLARRVAQRKPVVAVRSGYSTQGVPLGHTVQPLSVPSAAVDAMFSQSGVIRVDTTSEMFDVAQILAYQPMPRTNRVKVIGNSGALGLLATDALAANGMTTDAPLDLGPTASTEQFAEAVRQAAADESVGSVLIVFTPVLMAEHGDDVAAALARAARDSDVTVVTTFLGLRGVPPSLRQLDELGVPTPGSVPSFASPEEAARALGQVARYAAWRRRAHGSVPEVERHQHAARELLRGIGSTAPEGRLLDPAETHRLFHDYGVEVLESAEVGSLDDALAAQQGFPGEVVLKATAEHLRGRPDQSDVWRNISDGADMRDAWQAMTETLAAPEEAHFVVQPMAPGGVPVVIRAREDPRFGPVVSFGLSGITTELLGDRAYRIPPLTDVDAADMVREIRAAPLLLGYGGAEVVDLAAIEDLLHRVSAMVDDLPELARVELTPVLVGPDGATVLDATVQYLPPIGPREHFTRRMS
ncbi:MAG TPA: GNAT family N-acetyltransferase [Jiangellaceae bacterium]|nr:GNAT family N-acetyltransferase [Jiangellaceae bacterium]